MHALDYNSSLCYVDWFHNRSVIAALICIFSSFKFLDFIQFCVQVYEMTTKNKYNIYCTFRFEFCFFFKFLMLVIYIYNWGILLVTTTRNCFGFLGFSQTLQNWYILFVKLSSSKYLLSRNVTARFSFSTTCPQTPFFKVVYLK